MLVLLIIIFCFVTIAIVFVVIRRIQLKQQLEELCNKMIVLSSYGKPYDRQKAVVRASDNNFIVDIVTDLEDIFQGQFISSSQKKDFIQHYRDLFDEAYSLTKKLEIFSLEPSVPVKKMIRDFGMIHTLVKEHNVRVVQYTLETYKEFFDHCLSYSLDTQQRRSIISEEDNCLVVSSAGSGKTSSIVGKVSYLTEIKKVDPKKILLISYTNKAAAELTERIAIPGLKGYTFHKLALEIIGQVTGIKPFICDYTDALFVKIYRALLEKSSFKQGVVKYFMDYQVEEEEEQYKDERREYLVEQKQRRLKAMFPDMDGNVIRVKSEQEQKICFVLSSFGVKFRYEEPYEYPLADEEHSQYKPDFSIYFEKNGELKRIYLEHFGIDEHGRVPLWFAEHKQISHEEAEQEYNDGIKWKKEIHKKFGTKLLTTSSADFYNSTIRKELKILLHNAGVPIQQKDDDELYDLILPKESKQEKAFIRLIVTFVTLIKSSCKSVEEVLQEAMRKKDERSVFVINEIFLPVYERYCHALSDSGQIDFTDLILRATEICHSVRPVQYDYIIVDEFQDISVDRYQFLKALREGDPPAKLYCVGDDWQSIYRFSGSDMALFNQFSEYFGVTEINKIETTYRFGEPLISLSSQFIQRNRAQMQKEIHPFSLEIKTEVVFYSYDRRDYCYKIGKLVASVPTNKSIFLLGRYSFDDYYLSLIYQSRKRGSRFFYMIEGREVEFLTVHKSKGLEADYVIILQCNKDTYGFPSLISDDPVLNYVLTKGDQYPYGEERRLFYVAITRAKIKTYVLYDQRFPSVFVEEFLHPKVFTIDNYEKHPNANKRWTRKEERFLLAMHQEGKSVKYIATKMGRSQTSIVMRLDKLKGKQSDGSGLFDGMFS